MDEDTGRALPQGDPNLSVSSERVYVAIPPMLATVLSSMLQSYYHTFFPDAVVTWYFFKTRGGARDQPIHRNFALSRSNINPMDSTSLPGSLISATMDDTVIHDFGWNHQVAFESNKMEIKLQMGDMLFLRGDFIHSQTGYSYNNLIVHAFMGAISTANPWSRVQLVPLYEDNARGNDDDYQCYVWGCEHEATSQRSLNRHVRGSHNFLVNSAWRDPHLSRSSTEDTNAIVTDLPESRPAVSVSLYFRSSDDAIAESSQDEDSGLEILVATDSDTDSDTIIAGGHASNWSWNMV